MLRTWKESDEYLDTVVALVGGEAVVTVATTPNSNGGEDCAALRDAVQDEWGHVDNFDAEGEMFEIVAVPDDVAVTEPAADEICLIGTCDACGYELGEDCVVECPCGKMV